MNNQRNLFPKVDITGERSIRFSFGNHISKEIHTSVRHFCELIEKEFQASIEEYVPSYHTVTVYVKNNYIMKEKFIINLLTSWEQQQSHSVSSKIRTLKVPVCYEEEFAFDMDRVMNYTGLSAREIIYLHSSTTYTVFMIGFLPGFPYLGGLNEELSTPRLEKPRLKVSQGTVGIGGNQTGIYPLESPGGWNIIGRTPIEIYTPEQDEPFFIRAGDHLTFYSITTKEYKEWKANLEKHPESIKEILKNEPS